MASPSQILRKLIVAPDDNLMLILDSRQPPAARVAPPPITQSFSSQSAGATRGVAQHRHSTSTEKTRAGLRFSRYEFRSPKRAGVWKGQFNRADHSIGIE